MSLEKIKKVINIGDVFGYWKVVEINIEGDLRRVVCECQGCEKEKTIRSVEKHRLRSGKTSSCGCQSRKKARETTLDKYGSDHFSKTEDFKNKSKETFIKNYGCENPNQNNEVLKKRHESFLEKCEEEGFVEGARFNYWEIIEVKSALEIVCKCTGCNQEIRSLNKSRLKTGKTRSCGCMNDEVKKKTNLDKFGYENVLLSPDFQKRIKQTNLEKYGYENPNKNREIIKKRQKTCLEKYGTTNNLQSEASIQKGKKTSLERYGYESALSSLSIHAKIKQTNLEKYGYAKPAQSKEVVEKAKKTSLERYGVDSFSKLPENRNKLNEWCNEHPEMTYSSKKEVEVSDYFKQFFSDVSKQRLVTNDKSKSLELDICSKEAKVAIEYNGIYYHCTERLALKNDDPENYHLRKTKLCEKNNIRLIHIWEHEWLKKKSVVENYLKSNFSKNKIIENCYEIIIKKVDTNILNFLNYNSLEDLPFNFEDTIVVQNNNKILAVGILKDNVILNLTLNCEYEPLNLIKNLSNYIPNVFFEIDYRLGINSNLFSNYKVIETINPLPFYWNKKSVNLYNISRTPFEDNHTIYDCGKITIQPL